MNIGIGAFIFIIIMCVAIGAAALVFRKTIMKVFNAIVDFITAPVSGIYEALCSVGPSWGVLSKPEFLGGIPTLLLFLAAAVFVVFQWLTQWQDTHDIEPMLETLLYNTSFGSFITILTEGFDFESSTIIAAGFSSLLATFCMRNARRAHWSVWVIYSAVFICTTAILGSYLSDYFPGIAQWFTELWDKLAAGLSGDTATFGQVMRFIGNLLLFILVTYTAIVLLLLIVQEYLYCVIYGLVIMSVLCLVCLIGQAVYPNFGGADHWTYYLLSFGLIFGIMGTDILRDKLD